MLFRRAHLIPHDHLYAEYARCRRQLDLFA